MATLFIGFDFFCPGPFESSAFTNAAECYSADADALFLVLQPMILTGGAGAIDPLAYFKLGGGDVGATLGVRFLAGPGAQADIRAVRDAGVPVPFPPETRLDLSYTAKPGDSPARFPRTLPSLDPTNVTFPELYLPCDQWPDFAESNFALPPLTSYAQIDTVAPERRDTLRRDVESWSVAAVTAILDADRKGTALSPAERAALAGPLAPIKTWFGQDVTRTEEALRTLLRAPAADPLAGQLWTMLTRARDEALQSPPPRLLHDRDSLAIDPVVLLELGDPANRPASSSFHRSFWNRMLGEATRAATAVPPAYDELNNMLGRLFAFGERLRWSTSVAGRDAFMVLKEDSARAKTLGWNAFGTNVHSLLGQVFRLPFGVGDALDAQAALTVSVGGTASIDIMPAIKELIADLLRPRTLTASLARDAMRPGGFFIYAPRMAEATPAAVPQALDPPAPIPEPSGRLPGVLKQVHAVPAALLDVIDPAARTSSHEVDTELQQHRPPRTGLRPAELHVAAALGARVKALSLAARLSRVPVSAAGARLFRLDLPGAMHIAEKEEIRDRFLAIWSTPDASFGEIWLPGAAGVPARWRIAGHILSSGADPDGMLRAVLADRDGRLTTYFEAAPAPAQGTHPVGDAGIEVELLLPSPAAAPLFNRLLTGEPAIAAAPLCILNSRFASQVSMSTDRLLDRFETRLDPEPLDPAAGPVALTFGNFDKLRLSMSSTDPAITGRWESPGKAKLIDGVAEVYLTYPDAAAPMDSAGYADSAPPWVAAAPQSDSRFNGYFISHVFTQDSRADDTTGRADPAMSAKDATARNQRVRNAAEALRYVNYLTPATPWQLQGYLEHQYSYRFAVSGPSLALPLTTAIAHAGQAMQAETRPALGKTPDRAPLVEWTFDGPSATITLGFPTRYLKHVLAESEDIRPARLRSVYEPLADLLLAVDTNNAYLKLQGWCFSADDATKVRLPTEEETDDGGDISSNMRLALTLQHPISARDATGLQTARDLLSHPFSRFEEEVAKLAAKPDATWMEVKFAIKAPDWTGLGALAPKDIEKAVDLLRLGLSVARPARHVMPPSPATAPGFPLEPDAEQIAAYPALQGQSYAALKNAAASELATFTAPDAGTPDQQPHPSPLRRKFAWLRSAPTVAEAGQPVQNPELVKDARRFARLFGEAAAFSVAPPEKRPPIDEVVDLFYVPLAFRPLRAHHAFGDPATTLEFAEFLVRALDDLAAGRSNPGGIALKPTTSDAAYAAAQDLQTNVVPLVAGRLAQLLHWVHEDPDPASSELLRYAHDETMAALGAAGRAEFERLLRQFPSLFLTSQGFGFAWIDQADWQNRLHSLQIRKRIEAAGSKQAERGDVDKFNFRGFFRAGRVNALIDVLDDSRYDNEFEIDRPSYSPGRRPWTRIDHGSGKRAQVTRLGHVQARTGEEVIDTRNSFDTPSATEPPGNRTLLVDALHWNENWIRDKSQPLYLLPSRRFPAMPLKVTREGAEGWAARPSELEIDFSQSRPDTNAQLKALLARYDSEDIFLTLAAGTRFKAQPMAKPALYRGAITDRLHPGTSEPVAHGWWAVDTYASEHYFIVEDDGDNPDAPFSADLFEIISQVDTRAFADELLEQPPAFVPTDGIGRWFQYLRLKNNTPEAAPPSPEAMTQEEVIAAFKTWLTPAVPENGLLCVEEPAVAKADVEATEVKTSFTVSSNPEERRPEPAKLLETSRNGGPNDKGVAGILLAEILKLAPGKGTASASRYVLRVVMLDDRWRYSRVRIRIIRNARDVNNDNMPDINQAFRLVGAYSAWSSQQLVASAIDFTSWRPGGAPAKLTDLKPPFTLNEFMTAGTLNYGPLIQEAVAADFEDTNGARLPLWNTIPGSDLAASGIVFQKRHDLHPRYGTSDLSTVANRAEIPGRVGERPLQHLLPDGPFVTLKIDRELVLSPFHQIRINWSRNETVVMSCTWPVFFTH